MMRRLFFILPLTAFVGLLVYFSIGLRQDPSAIPSVLINKPVPSFDMAAIEGHDVGFSTEDLNGEVSLINFFGSWCVACRIEHPLLMELAAANEIPIYGVDWKDPPGAGAAWLERFGDPYTKVGDDSAGRVAIDFGITGAPETFVIDKHARIRLKYAGPITPQIWETEIEPIILMLRAED